MGRPCLPLEPEQFARPILQTPPYTHPPFVGMVLSNLDYMSTSAAELLKSTDIGGIGRAHS